MNTFKVELRPSRIPDAYENKVASIIRVLAIVTYIGGVIWGLTTSSVTHMDYSEFMWSSAFTKWITAFLSGTILLGFAEIISLLYGIQTHGYETNDIAGQLAIVIQKAISEDDKTYTPPIVRYNENEILFEYRPEKEITCPKCGQTQPSTQNQCKKCGIEFVYKRQKALGSETPV